jgi:tetratricopeptide (TPR) repeat protein
MTFEKAKVLKAAEKFLSQGKINAAIKEYRQIVEHDADDLTALNMLGDLLARAGEKNEAIQCFSRIAEHYREQEFRLKAIAMYRKIEKLKPRDPETANTLADLYAAQGLIVDARAQYLVVADAYTKAGDTREALQTLHKIADLDPHNTNIRLKLAESYLKEKMQTQAVKVFNDAAQRLFENGAFEQSLQAYSRAIELSPNDRTALKGLVSAHVAMGTAEDAAEVLQKAVEESPDDTELLSMLAQAYIEAENPVGAEQAMSLLMSQDASNYRRYIEIARVYLKLGQENEAARVLGTIVEPMLAAREENDLLELVNELLARNPEHVASLRLLARIHWWQRDMEKLRSVLERLAESAEAAGLVDDERYALTQLVRLAPDEPRYLERLNTIGGFLEEASEEPAMEEEPSPAVVPTFESFAIVDPSPETSRSDIEPVGAVDEFEWNSVAEEPVGDPSASFAELNEADSGTVIESGYEGVLLTDAIAVERSEAEVSHGGASIEAGTPEVEKAPSELAMMQQELESVDFYITQGYDDIARDTLQLLERQFGSRPEITSRREKLAAGTAGTGSPDQFDLTPEIVAVESQSEAADHTATTVDFSEFEETTPAKQEPGAAQPGSGIDSGLAEIFEEFRAEAEGEQASSHEDYETHYNMATAYKEMDLLDDAIREFQTAAGLTAPTDGSARYFQCCNMLGHCFLQKNMPRAAVLWFKKGIESPGRSADEYKALQYELGSAYDQMGDLNRAIEVFTEVYGVDVDYRDIADKLQDLQTRKASQKKKKGKEK